MKKPDCLRSLHRKGEPVILYNVWDAGSAAAVADAGASALATGSAPVAFANGFADGEQIPMPRLFEVARSIVGATELPVSIDFEGAYATDPEQGALNVGQLIDTGAIGLNFEDQVVGGEGLHPVAVQSSRISAIRAMAGDRASSCSSMPAPTCSSRKKDAGAHAALMPEAIARVRAYAGGRRQRVFFAPRSRYGRADRRSCVMRRPCRSTSSCGPASPMPRRWRKLGVSRIQPRPLSLQGDDRAADGRRACRVGHGGVPSIGRSGHDETASCASKKLDGDIHAVDRRRHAAIDRHLENDLKQFAPVRTGRQGMFEVDAQLWPGLSAQRGKRRKPWRSAASSDRAPPRA